VVAQKFIRQSICSWGGSGDRQHSRDDGVWERADVCGSPLSGSGLIYDVVGMEDRMTASRGWQDQAGGVYPGVNPISSGPVLWQMLRIMPVVWNAERQVDVFRSSRFCTAAKLRLLKWPMR
jgi:hypothetical protein